MKNPLPSLITPNAQAGLALAATLAGELHTQLDQVTSKVKRPGSMNCLLPAPVPLEVIGSILFHAIAAANQRWGSVANAATARRPEHARA